MNKKEINSFMRDVELLIPIKDANSRKFLSDMKDSISDFISQRDETDREMVISEFGSPKDIAMDYVESIDAEDLLKRLSLMRVFRRLTVLVALSLIIALSIFSYFQYRGYVEAKNAIITKEQTIIIYGDEP